MVPTPLSFRKNFEVIEPEMFKEVDDHVFLISAAITAYNDRRAKDVRQWNVLSHWKKLVVRCS